MRGLWRLQAARRQVRTQYLRFVSAPRAVILLYHRVVDLAVDPFRLSVSPSHFAEHLEAIRSCGQPMRLHDLVAAVRRGTIPERAVAVTFDDGYADNLFNAKPLLERYDIPATVFVASGYLGGRREFWGDEIERLVLTSTNLPTQLHLKTDDGTFEWILAEPPLGESAANGKTPFGKHKSISGFGSQQDLFKAIYLWLYHKRPEKRDSILNQLREWSGTGTLCRPTHRPLSSAELVELAEGGLVEIGAHTVTHPVLSAIPTGEQAEEIRRCKIHLERILARRVASFAYPHGRYNAKTVKCVREAGYDYGCAVSPDPVVRRTDPFQMPRYEVHDGDGERIQKFLSEVFA